MHEFQRENATQAATGTYMVVPEDMGSSPGSSLLRTLREVLRMALCLSLHSPGFE